MIDDPLALLSYGIWLMAAGMYPIGFLFGACSACCEEEGCQSNCNGFDLTKAYESPASFCGAWDEDYGPYGTDAPDCDTAPANVSGCGPSLGDVVTAGTWGRRRSCVRFVCRCYEADGEGGYSVVSTTIVGGPTTNNLDLEDELDNATFGGSSLEDYVFANTDFGNFLSGAAGTTFCMIWVFKFYGWRADCETTYTGIPTPHEPRDDCYKIAPCSICP